MHCIADASGTAHGAALYARSNGASHLLCSKNRVLPNSSKTANTPATIPRLELQAASLAANLLTVVKKELRVPTATVQLWIDSQCVINWLNSQERQERYIENRLTKIRLFPVIIANYGSGSEEESEQVGSGSEGENEEVKAPRKQKSYSAEFKLKVVKFAKDNDKAKAAVKFGVDRKQVRNWVKQENQLPQIKNSSPAGRFKKKLSGGGRKVTFKELDKQLSIWVRERRSKKLRISHTILQQKAVQMFNSEQDEAVFKGSRGWLRQFLTRHNFRLPETAKQLREEDRRFSSLRLRSPPKNNYQQIFAADETAVHLDPSGGKCIDELGAKEISVLTTGHNKARITVMLTARSDGKKCKPFVLLPRKRMDKEAKAVVEKFKGKLELCWKGKVRFDDEMTGDYLDRVFGRSLFGKRLLVWDAFRCHLSEATKKKLREIELHTAVVPGGCTKFIQAPDVSWNGPFKAQIRKSYDRWMSNDAQKKWTTGGNPKAPSMDVYLQWIVDAWDSLPTEAIAKSFKDCGITICHDGSKDDQVHCFKEHGPIPDGQFELMEARYAIRQAVAEPEEVDSDENEDNGYVSDESLVFENDDINDVYTEFYHI